MSLAADLHRDFLARNQYNGSRELKRGEHLYLAGTPRADIYYIEAGTLYTYIDAGEGEQIIRFGYAGDFVLALDSVLSGKPTQFNVRALRRCQLLRLPLSALNHLYDTEAPAGKDRWLRVLRWALYGSIEREIDLLTTKPEERYRRVLQRSPRLFQEVPLKYIANYLRMSPETLSRIRNS